MNDQHLSDEAVAACADGYLTGHARERATRHIAKCAECAAAVRGQREAAWALRTAAPPALPADLIARLRSVPQTTPITPLPTTIASDGSTMLSTSFAPMAALVPPRHEPTASPDAGEVRDGKHRVRPFVTGAAVVALAGALAAVPAASHATGPDGTNVPGHRAGVTQYAPGQTTPAVIMPVSVFRTIGR